MPRVDREGKRWLWALIALGTVVRLAIAATTDGVVYDVESFQLTRHALAHDFLHAFGALNGPDYYRWPYPPGFFAWMLCGLDLWLSPPRELAIVGDVGSPVARAALAPFRPRTVVAVGPADDVPLLAGKGLVDDKAAVYVCERFACLAPITEPEEVAV